jgi:23S rRNA pseudouridine2605 synthase
MIVFATASSKSMSAYSVVRRLLYHSPAFESAGRLSSCRKTNVNFRCVSSRSPRTPDDSNNHQDLTTQRLSKLIAVNAAMSRREAERLIRAGEVKLAGEVVRTPHMMVAWDDLQDSSLQIQGKAVKIQVHSNGKNDNASTAVIDAQKTRVWVAHKLSGEIVSDSDPLGRPSLMQRLIRGGVGKDGKHNKIHLKPIGRLDMPTEGIILLTNDGNYAREMELPSNMVHRVYRVRAHGLITDYKLARIQNGLTIEGVRYAPMKVKVDGGRSRSTNSWLQVTCCEGKNRQIRNVFKHLGCKFHNACGRFVYELNNV